MVNMATKLTSFEASDRKRIFLDESGNLVFIKLVAGNIWFWSIWQPDYVLPLGDYHEIFKPVKLKLLFFIKL